MPVKILIVDDESFVQHLITNGTFGNWECECACAFNGIEALRMARDFKPDLIISDVLMPHMSGWDFCKCIKTLPELRHVPFIFLSALGGEKNRLKGLQMGADEFVVKPFDPAELESIANRLLTRKTEIESMLKIFPSSGNILVHLELLPDGASLEEREIYLLCRFYENIDMVLQMSPFDLYNTLHIILDLIEKSVMIIEDQAHAA